MRVGSLFSGIGGLERGLELCGMEVIWQSEIDSYARLVLEKHWPGVPNLGDITKIDWSTVARPDLICGGFPCQDLSSAHTATGGRRGLDGRKSGLWTEYLRCIVALRPRWVVIENVAQFTAWVPSVRADLSLHGYASVPMELPAGAVGAPHQRRRIFVVANSDPDGQSVVSLHDEASRLQGVGSVGAGWGAPHPPESLRVDDGLPDRVDRTQTLGNAVVPQVAELVGRLIVAASA